MAYSIKNVLDGFSVDENILNEFLIANKIAIGKNGKLSEQSYHLISDYLKNKLEASNQQNNRTKESLSFDLSSSQIPAFQSSDNRVVLYQDDAIHFLKSLPDESIDLIITDPAYSGMNQKLKLGSGKIIGKYSDAGKSGAKWFEEFHDTVGNYRTFLIECLRVLKNNRHLYLMFDSYSLLTLAPVVREIFDVKNVICWDKANIGLGHYFRRRHEFILFASKGKRPLNSKNIPDVWKIKRLVSAKYPTQKPTEIFELMLMGSAESGFVVCDPFFGSGSSIIAALKSHCSFIGSDISDKAVVFSKDRVEHYLKTKKDIAQKQSLLSDDEAISKLFLK
jgi:site-specific DNA-methyltransferase (adenine-specific)